MSKRPAQHVIDPIQATSTYELVVDQVRRAIHLGRFLPGDKLPPERELARQLGVSRTTVREAVRVLEDEGLVESRRGATGGLVVLKPGWTDQALRKTVREHLNAIREVFDYRTAVECAASGLAAERRTKADVAMLHRILTEMGGLVETEQARGRIENVPQFGAADAAFHLGIARAARNAYLLQAVEDARAAMFLPVGAVFQRLVDNANDFHEAIFTAIEAQMPRAAEEAMRAHIAASRQSVEEFLK